METNKRQFNTQLDALLKQKKPVLEQFVSFVLQKFKTNPCFLDNTFSQTDLESVLDLIAIHLTG